MIKKGTEEFSGYNKPKATPKHPTKSHAVLAKEGDTVKLIRFGQQGVSGAGSSPDTPKDKARRSSRRASAPLTPISAAMPSLCAPGVALAFSTGWSGQR